MLLFHPLLFFGETFKAFPISEIANVNSFPLRFKLLVKKILWLNLVCFPVSMALEDRTCRPSLWSGEHNPIVCASPQ